MIIAENNGGGSRVLISAGTHVARCYGMVEVGTITEDIMGESKTAKKVRVSWEFPNELHIFDDSKGPQPLAIHKEFTLSMHEKASLRKYLESWRGKQYTEADAKRVDVSKLIGAPCMITVMHKVSKSGNTYAEITGIAPVMKGMTCPDQINKSLLLYFNMEGWQEVFDTLPDFLKDKIKTSREFQNFQEPTSQATSNDSDLPF